MDKVVSRVTVVQGSGPTREAKTVYDGHEEEFPTIPIDSIVRSVTVIEGRGRSKVIFKSRYWEDRDDSWKSGERGMRRFLKADMIRAQETYRQHVESASEDKQIWWLDLPANMVRAFIKAERKVRKEDKRTKDVDADVTHVKADARDLGDDLKAAAVDTKRDIKAKTSDIKTRVKGI